MTLKDLMWLRASEVAQTRAIPGWDCTVSKMAQLCAARHEERENKNSDGASLALFMVLAAYRTLKLGSLATATFNDVFDADIRGAKLLFTLARSAAGSTISAAIPIHAVTISIRVRMVECLVVFGGPGPPMLFIRAGRIAPPATAASGRRTTPQGCP